VPQSLALRLQFLPTSPRLLQEIGVNSTATFLQPLRTMPSKADLLRARARKFGTRVLRFVRTLPRDPAGTTIAYQLARAGSGVSSNYHSAGRARSRAEFIARLGVVVDEADESVLWLTKAKDSEVAAGTELEWLLDESRQLRAIFSTALATARRNRDADGGGESNK
jgi:four helix bundle protein